MSGSEGRVEEITAPAILVEILLPECIKFPAAVAAALIKSDFVED